MIKKLFSKPQSEVRTIFARLELDEIYARNVGTGEYFETEMDWLISSGIILKEWLIADSDDESEWGRYITYLVEWAMDHSGEYYEGMSPASYDEWRSTTLGYKNAD